MLILQNPLLETFESIARLGTTHAAAKELKITQTAVTQRLKALELGLKTTLFLRSRRGMALTEEAKALLQLYRGSKELEGQFQSAIQGKDRHEVTMRLIGPTSAISNRVAKNICPLFKQFPFLRLHLQSEDHRDLVEMIRRGEADLAVVSPSLVPNEMDSKRLRPDRYLLVACAAWKGRKLADILENERVIDFYESDQMTKRYLHHFELKTQQLKTRLFVNENEALMQFLLSGVGFATLTEEMAMPQIQAGKLYALNRSQVMEDPLALIWYPRPQKSDYFAEILGAIR